MAPANRLHARLLPELGFTVDSSGKEWCIFQAAGKGPVEFFGFTEARDHQPNDNRLAFWAASPEPCREYSPGYYALFFEDPSGNKLEICCRDSPSP